jgi:DNA topoisomerase-1
MTTLVIVESPTKAKALRQYLGREYVVRASMGHVRDLPAKELGIDLDAGFKPTYHLIPRARKTLAELRQALAGCDSVLLATDPDREGEAIAWHIAQACRQDLAGKQVLRARFHEITPEAVRAAVAQPTPLDMHLVDAQQARRVLDRLVGYQVSPVLWKGIAGPLGLSAGRVQSVALRLVVERDRAIEAFIPEEYWTLDADLSRPGEPSFLARLYRIGTSKLDKPELKTQAAAQAVIEALVGADWQVGDVTQARRTRNPYPPYITSTLQRDASARLHWPAKKVMQIAQQLYEGVQLPGEGQVGLITYMRTDCTQVAPRAQAEARQVIERLYGAEALPSLPPVYT